MTHVSSVNDVQVAQHRPGFGWGRMGAKKRKTAKAILFEYHRWDLWIAKANLVLWDGVYYAKTWAIDSAKEWVEQQQTQNQN